MISTVSNLISSGRDCSRVHGMWMRSSRMNPLQVAHECNVVGEEEGGLLHCDRSCCAVGTFAPAAHCSWRWRRNVVCHFESRRGRSRWNRSPTTLYMVLVTIEGCHISCARPGNSTTLCRPHAGFVVRTCAEQHHTFRPVDSRSDRFNAAEPAVTA